MLQQMMCGGATVDEIFAVTTMVGVWIQVGMRMICTGILATMVATKISGWNNGEVMDQEVHITFILEGTKETDDVDAINVWTMVVGGCTFTTATTETTKGLCGSGPPQRQLLQQQQQPPPQK
jgi:hypothetical protein